MDPTLPKWLNLLPILGQANINAPDVVPRRKDTRLWGPPVKNAYLPKLLDMSTLKKILELVYLFMNNKKQAWRLFQIEGG